MLSTGRGVGESGKVLCTANRLVASSCPKSMNGEAEIMAVETYCTQCEKSTRHSVVDIEGRAVYLPGMRLHLAA